MSKLVNRIAAVAVLALAATPIIGLSAAHAAEPIQPAARIKIGDLRLSRPADARAFDRRVDAAGRRACDAYGARALGARDCLADFNGRVKHALTDRQIAALQMANRAGAGVTLAAN